MRKTNMIKKTKKIKQLILGEGLVALIMLTCSINSFAANEVKEVAETKTDITIIVNEEIKPEESDPELGAEETGVSEAETEEKAEERIYYVVSDEGYQATLSEDLQDWVYQMCEEYGITGYEKTIIAKMYCESSFNENTKHKNKNGTTDYGISQINSCNHSWLRKELGITDFMDPKQSIRCGVYMMSRNLAKNDFNESQALVAYNTGRNGGQPTSYSKKVLRIKDSMASYTNDSEKSI